MTDFDAIIDRQQTASLKWQRYADRDILPMWVADMDFKAPPAVLAALQERLEHGVLGYSLPPPELVDSVVGYLERSYGWFIKPQWLVWLPGLVTGLNVACRAVGRAGESVLTTTPVYPPFLAAPPLSKRRLLTVPLVAVDQRWHMDFAALTAAVTRDCRLFLFCNPHNPTGRVYSRSELLELAHFCLEHELTLCADEIHCDLVLDRDARHIPIATLGPEIARRTITLMAPSKTYNIPGLGASLAIIPDSRLRSSFQGVMAGIVPYVNVMGLLAALAAYRDCEEWRRELLAYLAGNRDLVEQEVARMAGLSMAHVEATYLAWIDTRKAQLAEPGRFFEAAGVGLSDGAEFGAPGFVRLNFGCSRPLLQEALARMHSALAGGARLV